jgi:uncharacterized protein
MADDIVFEWDEAKRRANIAKHGIDFTLMALFEWGTAMIIPDDRHDEKRSIAIGMLQDRVHVAAITYRESKVRIISLRKANRREQRRFENAQSYSGH